MKKQTQKAIMNDLFTELTSLRTDINSSSKRLDQKLDTLKADFQAELGAVQSDLQAAEQRLDQKIDHVAIEVIKTNGRMLQMEERLIARMDAGFNWIKDTIDSFLGRLETYARETVTIPSTLDQHGKRLDDHDQRLGALESNR